MTVFTLDKPLMEEAEWMGSRSGNLVITNTHKVLFAMCSCWSFALKW